MNLTDIYSAKALAAYFTHAHSNDKPFLGLTLFPRKKKMGLKQEKLKEKIITGKGKLIKN